MVRTGPHRDGTRFDSWLADWKDHTWSRPSPRQWSRLQLTDSDVHAHTRWILSTPAPDSLVRLATVAEAVRTQRDKRKRCRAAIGDEARTLHEAGGTWSEIADWTTLTQKGVHALARATGPRVGPAAARRDDELAALVAQVPANPFFRICELLAAAHFFEAVANELDEARDWLCFELSSSGMGRTQIARRAQVGHLTLARRISRARRSSTRHRHDATPGSGMAG
jgi:hypothetical protein